MAAHEEGGTPRQLYEKLLSVFGAKRVMWSSNYPAHPKFGNIKERLRISNKALAFMSEEDQAWILGNTALSFYPAAANRSYSDTRGLRAKRAWP